VAVGYGKLLLFGEHAAVYGYPALGIRLAATLEVTIGEPEAGTEREQKLLTSLPSQARLQLQTALQRLPALLDSHYGTDLPPAARRPPVLERIAGPLPMSMGFGSSAAFCTAVIRSVFPGAERHGLQRFWAAAHELEHIFHGNPSGIDTGLSIFPGASLIEPVPGTLPIRSPCRLAEATLVVGAIDRQESTAALIAGLRRRREHSPGPVEERLKRLGEISREAAAAPDARTLGDLATEAQAHLCQLGLSTGALEQLLSVLRDAGALGAKLSGAGGGGAFFGVFSEHGQAKKAAVALAATAGVSFTEMIETVD